MLSQGRSTSFVEEQVKAFWRIAKIIGNGVTGDEYMCQVTYLLFIKVDFEISELGDPAHIPPYCQWPSLVSKKSPELRSEHYDEILATLSDESNFDKIVRNIFAKAQTKISNPIYLDMLIDLIDKTNWISLGGNLKFVIYEKLLAKIAQDKRSVIGKLYTPPYPLVKAMVELTNPRLGEVVVDPACGIGRLLLGAFDYMSQQSKSVIKLDYLKEQCLHGQDVITQSVSFSSMSLFLKGFESQSFPIALDDSLLSLPSSLADVILNSPPFGSRLIGSIAVARDDFVTQTSNSQLNFLQHIMSSLKNGGRAAVIVPESTLFEKEGANIRRSLLTNFNLHTILCLPKGVFTANIKTYVLFFIKGNATSDIWYYDLTFSKNFSPARAPITIDDLTDFVICFKPLSNGGYGERYETYNAVSNPNGRWRKFAASTFLKTSSCSLKVKGWISAPKTKIEQLDLEQLLDAMEQNFKTGYEALSYVRKELAIRTGPDISED